MRTQAFKYLGQNNSKYPHGSGSGGHGTGGREGKRKGEENGGKEQCQIEYGKETIV